MTSAIDEVVAPAKIGCNGKNEKTSSVAHGASRMGLATLFSRVLGLLREQVFAFLFGASNAADAFNIAFRIPNLLRDLFAEGAMSAAFVPNFAKALVESRRRAFELLAGVLIVLLITVSILSAVGMLFSHELVSLYAGSFQNIAGKFELSVGLTRVMFPFFPFVAMAAVVMGALNALGFFFLPAFAPVLFNVASIVAGLAVCPVLAHYSHVPPIYGMAVGVVVGGFLQFYIQWFQIRREGFSYVDARKAIQNPLRVPGVKAVLWLLIPGTVGLAATQLNILINSIYATSAGPGAVSWLNYAFRLMQFPIGIFGVSLAVATLPQVSRRLAGGDHEGAGAEVNGSLRMAFAVNGPAAAGLMGAGLPLVQLLFQHGFFQYRDSLHTASAIFWYALGLPGYSVVKVLVPVFYALGTTRVPVAASFIMVALNAAVNHLFLDILHYPFWSLALATSITATLNAIFLATWLAFKLPGTVNAKLGRALFFQGVVSAAIGSAAYGVVRVLSMLERFVAAFWGGRVLLWSLEVGGAIAVAGVIWWGLGHAFGIEENKKATEFILKKVRRSR